jgi:repressor LexA
MAIDMVVDYLPLYFTSRAEAEETICIIVRGDSMFPKIEDGDLIQVHKQSSVDSGQVGVVLIDGEEAFVKKVVYGETWIELHSFNPMYKTMRFNGADVQRIRVLGVVKKVIKEM